MENNSTSSAIDPEKDTPTQASGEKFFESNAGDGTTVYDQYLTGLPLYLCFFSCFMSLFLIGLDQTIVVTLFETVGAKFDAYDQIGWIASGYMITMAVFAQTWGKFSIIFGRKYSLLLAIVLFESGSLMSGLANSMNVLIGGRVLAGIGGGGIQTLVFIVGTEMVPMDKRALAFAFFGVAFSVSSICGPLVGGGFTENVTWRWCFFVNLPIGGLALFFLIMFFHPPVPKFTWKEKFQQIDYLGTFLLTSGCVVFLLALSFGGQEFAWDSGAVISCFVLGGATIIAFCVWNFKWSKNQIIPLVVVRRLTVDAPVVTLFFAFFCFLAYVVFLSTYFQIVHNAGPISTGVQMFPIIIPLVISSISTGILMKKLRLVKPFAVFGGVCGCIGFGLSTMLDVDNTRAEKIGYLILPGVSIGCLLQSGIMSAQLEAPKEPGSTILTTALYNFSRSLGGAIGSDLAQAIYNSSVKNKLRAAVSANPDAFSSVSITQLTTMLSSPRSLNTLPSATQKIIRQCIMDAIRNVFYTVLAVSCLTFVTALFFSNKRIPHEKDMQRAEEKEVEVETEVKTKATEDETVASA